MTTQAPLAMSESLAAVEGIELRHLCDISIDIEVQAIPSPAANRMNFALRRGEFRGERLSGTMRSNSGDWLVLGTDNIGRIDVRSTMETEEGELIYMTNTGRIAIPENELGALGSGEHLSWDRLYARSSPLFETGSEKYSWLNGVTTIAVNEIAIDHVDYRIFQVL